MNTFLLKLNTIPLSRTILVALALIVAAAGGVAPSGLAHADLPKFDDISKDYAKIEVTDPDAKRGFFTLWKQEKTGDVLAELPKDYGRKSFFVALTLSSGDLYAGLQSGDWVIKVRRYGDRLAFIAPNLAIRATGDAESKASVKRLFTDEVILDVPIRAMGPSGGPVIDFDSLLVDNVSKFFGPQVSLNRASRIRKLASAKVFPENVEIAFEFVSRSGQLQTVHYSFSEVPPISGGYKPRKADERVGYFITSFSDLSKYDDEETRVRYINRWRLEKRDPSLALSPPKEPIRFYIEHTTPVRYRRWVKAGVDYWNKAFEKVGLIDAIVIEYQDAQSGRHMEKDPEDVRYNFVRWLNNDIGTAIGPSRVHPETGEILDADIVLTDGWIRHFKFNFEDLMPQIATEGMSAETLTWLATHPRWDPRVRLASPAQAASLRSKFARQALQPMGGHPITKTDHSLLGDDPYDGLFGKISQKNGYCMAADSRALDLAMVRMNWALALMEDKTALEDEKDDAEKEGKDKDDAEKEDAAGKEDADKEDADKDEADKEEAKKDDKKKIAKDKPSDPLVDGMPEWFVGPLLADLVAHEVGHTLGLRHNFKASSLYTLEEINSKAVKGKKTFTASVMDYSPINYRYDVGEVQGDYGMIDIGPYDYWAIEYGYTDKEQDLPELLKRCVEPELQYATDEDTSGPDPLARRYDFSKDPLDFAKEQMKLVKLYREKLLTDFVDDGDSWAKARRGYELTLGLQTKASNMMANWIGGAIVNRDKKGDPGNRIPVEVVPAAQQRAALCFVMETMFRDEAFGLTPEILERMTVDKWNDVGGFGSFENEATWPIHDRVLGLQSSALTWVMNPTTLRRVYDNEMRLPADQEALTLPELLASVGDEVWSELAGDCPENTNDRKPMISSLRRNLQREHVQRLVDLVLEAGDDTAAYKPISNLARMQLKKLADQIEASQKRCGKSMDAYTEAHLAEVRERITRVLQAGYQYNGGSGGSIPLFMMFGETVEDATH
ncbi:MAG: zinc-dependent metalloprotease [Planctomycetota bacterium]